MKPLSLKKGFSLVEMLIYLAILVTVLGAVMYSLAGMTKWHRDIQASRNLDLSATAILDRMVLEIRNANAVDSVNSTFNTHPGRLTISGVDSGGSARIIEFFIQGTSLHVKENGTDQGPLSLSTVVVENFVVRSLTGGATSAVRIELRLSSSAQGFTKTANFYTTVILRGTYN